MPHPDHASWANPIEAQFGPLRTFIMANSNYPNHPALARDLHAYLRWRNANARHPDVLAAQRRERARIRSERQRRWGRPATQGSLTHHSRHPRWRRPGTCESMPTPSAAANRARPVVLVHGLWHQPGHFDEVARRLRHSGVEVSVPELHRGSLAADTAAVQQLVDTMSRPPIVLGHSYGGSVITGLTAFVHLVYVAAFVPTEHESAAALGGPHLIDTHRAPPRRRAHRTRPRRRDVHPLRRLHTRRRRPSRRPATPTSSGTRPRHSRAGGVGTVPSTYVVCTDDHAIDPAIQQRLATRCTTILSWATSHSPFCSRPELVVELLTDLVRRQPTDIYPHPAAKPHRSPAHQPGERSWSAH